MEDYGHLCIHQGPPHASPSYVSYGASIMCSLEINDHVSAMCIQLYVSMPQAGSFAKS